MKSLVLALSPAFILPSFCVQAVLVLLNFKNQNGVLFFFFEFSKFSHLYFFYDIIVFKSHIIYIKMYFYIRKMDVDRF